MFTGPGTIMTMAVGNRPIGAGRRSIRRVPAPCNADRLSLGGPRVPVGEVRAAGSANDERRFQPLVPPRVLVPVIDRM